MTETGGTAPVLATSRYSAFALEPFPAVTPGDDLAAVILGTARATGTALADGDVVVVASKAVSVAERRHVDLAAVTPTPEAVEVAARTGKPAAVVQLVLDNSTSYFLASGHGPVIAWHTLGYQLTSAGIDRDGDGGAWLLPADPDASARRLRDALAAGTGARVAVVIADSDGRADRRGSTVISVGAAGITPARVTAHAGQRQEETLTDLIAAAAGIILGQRGRGAPVAVLRGIAYTPGDEGVASVLHRRP